MMNDLLTSVRAWLLTFVTCAVLYPATTWAFAQVTVPESAAGSMIRDADGQIVGSRLIAQSFEAPHYLRPRPSAAGYDASATGGSNLGPSNPVLMARAEESVRALGPEAARPVPAELVAASGSGMDPHITLSGALFQIDRIADLRGVDPSRVERILRDRTLSIPWSPPLVNVLEANLALDEALGAATQP